MTPPRDVRPPDSISISCSDTADLIVICISGDWLDNMAGEMGHSFLKSSDLSVEGVDGVVGVLGIEPDEEEKDMLRKMT